MSDIINLRPKKLAKVLPRKTMVSRNSFLNIYDLKFFRVETLSLESQALKENPLKDPSLRHNPILVPQKGKGPWPVILVLSGFTGNGPKSFGIKSFENNFPQQVDQWFHKNQKEGPLVVFVDAMTFWGGSQFINSPGAGSYEDYIMKELIPTIKRIYSVKMEPQYWCAMGGSSGGYGALHLASRFPHLFGWAAALAPDSAFELNLLPEIISCLPRIEKLGGAKGIKKMLTEGNLQKQPDFHNIMNVMGMASCYAMSGGHALRSYNLGKGHSRDKTLGVSRQEADLWGMDFPIDSHTGELVKPLWREWQKHDPVFFLKKRRQKIKTLCGVLLDVGRYDQFNLQYGARRIYKIFQENKVSVKYSEFEGNHFDISSRRFVVWEWLSQKWFA